MCHEISLYEIFRSEVPNFSYCINQFNSLYTAEICAIYRALLFIDRQPYRCHLIATDCLGALQSLNSHTPDHPFSTVILQCVSHLQKAGKAFAICWMDDHVGLTVNRVAAAVAKCAILHGKPASVRALGRGDHM
jgi:ribonuclease HI